MQDRPPPLPDWPGLDIEQQQTVWNGRFPLQTIRFRYRRFDGAQSGPLTWELWRRGRAAAILPYDPITDQVVLLQQFRLPALAAGLDPIMTEIPAGLCEPGESEAETIGREIVEEIGLAATELLPIGRFLLTPGGADETIALFAGRVAAPATDANGIAGHAGLAHEHEDIRVSVHPARDAIEAAASGAYANSVAAIALLWLGLRRESLRERWLRAPSEGESA
jgi:ADP-ribose pyrophosphatase